MGRQLLQLEMRVQEPDGDIGLTDTFVVVTEVWGSVGGTEGAVHIGTTQALQEVTHRAVIPWVDPTTFSHVAAAGGAQRFRKHKARDPDNRRRWLELMLEEEVAEAEEVPGEEEAVPEGDAALLESGDFALNEDGSFVLLETA